jgi:hypothetical protein
METLINRELDQRGLGDVLMVTTTDRGILFDSGTCELSGNALLLSMEEDDMYTFLLRRRSRGLN